MTTDQTVRLAVSTRKGAYFLASDAGRKSWKSSGPFLETEDVNRIIRDGNGNFYAATLTEGVFKSTDQGKTWRPSSRGLHVRKVWTVEADPFTPGLLYAGTQYGHLFKSEDYGGKWEEVAGLHSAPLRDKWGVDWGFNTTGMTVHTVRADPTKKDRLYIIASGTGAYRSDDAGVSWKLLKTGVNESCPIGRDETPYSKMESSPEQRLEEHLEQVHSCFHKIVLSEKPGTVYLQDHCGVYYTDNFGEKWNDISPGKELRFGFPIDVVENSPGQVFVIPVPQNQEMCRDHNVCIRGQLAVYRTGDQGKEWDRLTDGLPGNVHTNVLRDSFSHDALSQSGLYFGTTTGELYSSINLGDSWSLIGKNLGRIQGVTAITG